MDLLGVMDCRGYLFESIGRRLSGNGVTGMGGVKSPGEELCANHVEMVIYWENFCLGMKMVDSCGVGASCYSSKSRVLGLL